MRVLQLTKFYPPHLGGIEAVTRDLSRALLARGASVDVVCANKSFQSVVEVDPAGVTVHRAASLGMLQSTSVAPAMVGLLRRLGARADVIHVHMPDPMAALAVWFARPACPVVLHWHSDVVRQRVMRPVYRPLENWLLRRANAIIATSRRYAQSSRTLHPWLSKVHVVPVGVSPPPQVPQARVDEVRRRHGQRRIVFALGRMTYYKGYEVLIEAARLLPEDTVVVVGGGGQLLDHYRGLVQAAGLSERIRFVGPMSTANVEAHFAAAELFCLASTVRAEAYGVVVLEAMARGLAVVAPHIPGSGLNWLHLDGVTGVTVPAGDPPALAAGIQQLLADAPARQRYAQAGRVRWADGLTAQDMGDMTLSIYQSLLEGADSRLGTIDTSEARA